MNKTFRILTMAGMGLLTGMAIGAGPAQAAEAAGTPAAKLAASQSTQVQQHRNREQIVGYYRSARACNLAGRIGERFNKWDDYDCEYVRFGFRRGAWALEVERDWNWGRPGGFHGHRPGGWGDHRPGGFGDNRPGGFGDNRDRDHDWHGNTRG